MPVINERSYHYKAGAHWDVFYIKTNPQIKYELTSKFHISIDQKKLTEVYPLIVDILSKNSVHYFKFRTKEEPDRNLQGKELVIYIQKDIQQEECASEADPNFWITLLNQIEDSLKQVGVTANQTFTPQGDKLFPGSNGYTYFRYPYNVFDHYVEATLLSNCGFTNSEAFNLSGTTDLEDWLSGLTLHEQTTNNINNDPIPKNSSANKEIAIKLPTDKSNQSAIKEQFLFDLTKNDAKKIYFSEGKASTPDEKKINLLLTKLHTTLTNEDSLTSLLKNDSLFQFINACLDLAAEYTSVIQNSLSEKTEIGNITPIFYHQCVVPIAQALKNQEPIIPEKLIDKDSFIRDIVKCSLRAKDIQINLDKPQYQQDLTEELLDTIIQTVVASKNNASPGTTMFFATKAAPREESLNVDAKEQTAVDSDEIMVPISRSFSR